VTTVDPKKSDFSGMKKTLLEVNKNCVMRGYRRNEINGMVEK